MKGIDIIEIIESKGLEDKEVRFKFRDIDRYREFEVTVLNDISYSEKEFSFDGVEGESIEGVALGKDIVKLITSRELGEFKATFVFVDGYNVFPNVRTFSIDGIGEEDGKSFVLEGAEII